MKAKKLTKSKPQKTATSKKRPAKAMTPTGIEQQYPNVATWVRGEGWIEIGEMDWRGFQVRALDAGGMVCENSRCRSLAGAMEYLEKALGTWLKEQGR